MPSKTLDEAIEKVHQLPDEDQERIGRELNDYIDHLRALRSAISDDPRSLGGNCRQGVQRGFVIK